MRGPYQVTRLGSSCTETIHSDTTCSNLNLRETRHGVWVDPLLTVSDKKLQLSNTCHDPDENLSSTHFPSRADSEIEDQELNTK